jgi:plasmid stabilization system protein ParE
MNSYKIIVSPRATAEYKEILRYISLNFGHSKVEETDNNFIQIINQIANNPSQFPYFSKRKKIRKCVISSQTTLYYRLDEDVVNLLSFRSNFMNPRTRNL